LTSKDKLSGLGFATTTTMGEQLRHALADEIKRWAALVQAAKMKMH
jgi:hypothetical protein